MTTNNNFYCLLNTTTTPVTSATDYEGSFESTQKFNGLYVHVFTDKKGLLYIEYSEDTVNIEVEKMFYVSANSHFHVTEVNKCRYFRVRFHNSSGLNATVTRITSRLTEIDRSKHLEKLGHPSNLMDNVAFFNPTDISSIISIHQWRTANIFYEDDSYLTVGDIIVQLSHDGVIFHNADTLTRTLTATKGVAHKIVPVDGMNFLRLYNDTANSWSNVIASAYGMN